MKARSNKAKTGLQQKSSVAANATINNNWDYSWTPPVQDRSRNTHSYYNYCDSCDHHTYYKEEYRIGEFLAKKTFPASDLHPSFSVEIKGNYQLNYEADFCSCSLNHRRNTTSNLELTTSAYNEQHATTVREAMLDSLIDDLINIDGVTYSSDGIVISEEYYLNILQDDYSAYIYFVTKQAEQFEFHQNITNNLI